MRLRKLGNVSKWSRKTGEHIPLRNFLQKYYLWTQNCKFIRTAFFWGNVSRHFFKMSTIFTKMLFTNVVRLSFSSMTVLLLFRQLQPLARKLTTTAVLQKRTARRRCCTPSTPAPDWLRTRCSVSLAPRSCALERRRESRLALFHTCCEPLFSWPGAP